MSWRNIESRCGRCCPDQKSQILSAGGWDRVVISLCLSCHTPIPLLSPCPIICPLVFISSFYSQELLSPISSHSHFLHIAPGNYNPGSWQSSSRILPHHLLRCSNKDKRETGERNPYKTLTELSHSRNLTDWNLAW